MFSRGGVYVFEPLHLWMLGLRSRLRAHLLNEGKQIIHVPVLNEFAVGDAPDRNALPSQLLTRRRENRGIGSKLDRMIVRCRYAEAGNDFVVRDDAVLGRPMKIWKHLEVVLEGRLHTSKSLPLVCAMLNVIVGDDVLQRRQIAGVDVREILLEELGVSGRHFGGIGASSRDGYRKQQERASQQRPAERYSAKNSLVFVIHCISGHCVGHY